jgi:hypothetical protein
MDHERGFFSDHHIYRDLTIALGLLLVLNPVINVVLGWSRIDQILTAAFLVFALFEITRRRSDLVIGLVLGLPAIAGGIFNAATPDTPLLNLGPVVLTASFIGFLVWRILGDVLSGSRETSEQICGAICAYLLIGFLFASIYGFVVLVDPGAFNVPEQLTAHIAGGGRSASLLTYYSFVTMSTLGYGDIVPVSNAARTLAWIQAVVGQLYLAIVIAALVGAHIGRRKA